MSVFMFCFFFYFCRSALSSIDEARSLDRLMPLPRTKKPFVSSANSTTFINHVSATGGSNNHYPPSSISGTNAPATTSAIAVSFAPQTNTTTAVAATSSPMLTLSTTITSSTSATNDGLIIARPGTAAGTPLPPPRRAAAQQRFVVYCDLCVYYCCLFR